MPTSAKVLCDSINPAGDRLTTFELTFPRIVLAEANTHKDPSRNSASSRAIPSWKMINNIIADTFFPNRVPVNGKGMQPVDYWHEDDPRFFEARGIWHEARDLAIQQANKLLELGVHKQLTNRLLEPFMHHTAIFSGTNWSTVFGLRCHPDAQDQIREVMEMARDAKEASIPDKLEWGDWHLPLVGFEGDEILTLPQKTSVSAGRCARVSYLTHDGSRDVQADLGLFDRLAGSEPFHYSPLEHPAQAKPGKWANYDGFKQLRWYAERNLLDYLDQL